MVRELNILFGFEAPSVEQKIINCLKSYGVSVTSSVRYTRPTIKDYLLKNKDVDIVFLKEFLDGGEKYSANEMAEVADITRARFIVVVKPGNRGREAMKTLYCAGIVDAYFSDDKKGVSPEELAKAAVLGRTRLEARNFYAIDSPMPDYGVINYADYRDCYSYLKKGLGDGSQEIDRFIDLTRVLSVKQLYQFYKKLPEQDVSDLMAYKEFYDIMDVLRGRGLPIEKFKRPRGLLSATGPELADEVMRQSTVRKGRRSAPAPVENPDFSEFRTSAPNAPMSYGKGQQDNSGQGTYEGGTEDDYDDYPASDEGYEDEYEDDNGYEEGYEPDSDPEEYSENDDYEEEVSEGPEDEEYDEEDGYDAEEESAGGVGDGFDEESEDIGEDEADTDLEEETDEETSDFVGKDNTPKNSGSQKSVPKKNKSSKDGKAVKSSDEGTSAEDIINQYL